MVKVKIISNKNPLLLEAGINEFLRELGSNNNNIIGIEDIKLVPAVPEGVFLAMILYSETPNSGMSF